MPLSSFCSHLNIDGHLSYENNVSFKLPLHKSLNANIIYVAFFLKTTECGNIIWIRCTRKKINIYNIQKEFRFSIYNYVVLEIKYLIYYLDEVFQKRKFNIPKTCCKI